MQASNLAQAGHRFFALAHSMNMHGRAAAMVTPIGDKKRLLPAESAVSSSGCAGQGRVKRAARERTNGSTQGCRERSDAKVCVSASVAEGPSATLRTGLLAEDSYKHSFPFSRSAFEVGSITPGTKVIISARRFQPFWCGKHATFRSQVDFATSAKSRSSRRALVAALHAIAPARSS